MALTLLIEDKLDTREIQAASQRIMSFLIDIFHFNEQYYGRFTI